MNYIKYSKYDQMSLEILLNDIYTIRSCYENLKGKNQNSMAFLGITPYYCIVIDSTVQYIDYLFNMEIISKEKHDLIKRLRGKIKLYNEKIKKNIEISDLIISYQNKYFKDYLKIDLLKMLNLYKDFGVYYVDDKYIGNTNLYCWYYGTTKKNDILDMESISLQNYEVGEILSEIINLTDTLGYNTIKINLLNNELNVYDKDYNLSRHKNKIFKDKYNIEITLMIFNILCSINFTLEYLSKIFMNDNKLYFRIRYNCLYYSLFSLNKIIGHIKMNYKENNHIKYLEDELNELKLKDIILNNKFRNCMAHYRITEEDLSEKEINYNVPFYGLIEKYFGKNYDLLNYEINNDLFKLSNILEDFILVKNNK